MDDRGLIVLAIGGNSLIRDEAHRTVPDQWALTRETCGHVAALVQAGYRVVVTHGNGPQVGFILRRWELAPPGAARGAARLLRRRHAGRHRLHGPAVARERVPPARRGARRGGIGHAGGGAADSPAFARPSKPIGSFMDEATARERAARGGWTVGEDAGRGFRRLVASPEPLAIVELDAIRTLAAAGYVVIAVGGGGIPVVRTPEGDLRGVEAVIDKDLASSLLARELRADALVISTGVRRVCLRWGQPDQRELERLSLAEARRYLAEGHFGAGSMAPKIDAAIRYLEAGGRRAVISCPEELERALAGEAGTTLVP